MQKEEYIQLSADTKLAEAILAQPRMLMLLDRFGLPLGLGDHTIETLCAQKEVNTTVFLYVCNLYLTGHAPISYSFPMDGLTCLLNYLQRSHSDYQKEQYPEIQQQISALNALNADRSVKMVETFFDEYMQEVTEHLNYENETVFPYIQKLQQSAALHSDDDFCVDEYKNHHDDIEEKLIDLKNLLIRYLPVQADSVARRKLLLLLFELEYDLHVHSLIEDTILIPMVEKLEKEKGL